MKIDNDKRCSDYQFGDLQVIIRLRPLSSSEISVQGSKRCVRQDSSQTITWTGHPESRFTFDIVADESVSQVFCTVACLIFANKVLFISYFMLPFLQQEMLFKVAGIPMVENCMLGYNSCMFAYGQVSFTVSFSILLILLAYGTIWHFYVGFEDSI